MPVTFGKHENMVPDYWRTFGARHSPAYGSPRGAVSPANAMLNYLYGLLIGEIAVALHAAGLDPFIGILHVDKDNRSSLAYDLIEPARPIVDQWLFHWLKHTTFAKRDFIESISGGVQLMPPLPSHLAMTIALWRGIAGQLVQWFVDCLTREKATALTLAYNITTNSQGRAHRWNYSRGLQRPIPATCIECGKLLPARKRKFCGNECVTAWYGGIQQRTVLDNIRQGQLAHTMKARAKRTATVINTHALLQAWRNRPDWSHDHDIALRAWYVNTLRPALAQCRPSVLARIMNVSPSYAITVRAGKVVPHPRHYAALASVVGIELPKVLQRKVA